MVHAQAAHMLNIYELGVPNSHVDQGQQTGQEDESPCQTPDNSRPNSPEQVNIHKYSYYRIHLIRNPLLQ